MGNDSVPGTEGFLSKALKAAFLGSSDYVFIKDTQLVYRAASDSVAELVGLPSADALTGKTDMNAEIAQRLLENFGLKVVRAENGAKAAELFSKSAPGEFAAILMYRSWRVSST